MFTTTTISPHGPWSSSLLDAITPTSAYAHSSSLLHNSYYSVDNTDPSNGIVGNTTSASVSAAAASAQFPDQMYANEQMYSCAALQKAMTQLRDPFAKHPPGVKLAIIAFYVIAATFGAMGNLLVIATVVHNPQMRTPRNLFIINLALSDFTMCTITVPFTMKFLLDNFWDLGRVMCRVVASLQGINVFVSTMSIAAIAMDRYLVILFPTRAQKQKLALSACFAMTWLLSIALAVPMYLTTDTSAVTNFRMRERCKIYVDICMEVDVFGQDFRRIYTICCFVFQYFLPLLTLTFVYSRIIFSLRRRIVFRSATADMARRREAEGRQTRMNVLLTSILLVFALSWLPLNIYMTFVSFNPQALKTEIFALCHLLGMTSACANPILYGLLNENFRREFRAILNKFGFELLLEKICPSNCPCIRGGSAQRSERNTSAMSPSMQSYRFVNGKAAAANGLQTVLKSANGDFLAVPQLNGHSKKPLVGSNDELDQTSCCNGNDNVLHSCCQTPLKSPSFIGLNYSSEERIPLNPSVLENRHCNDNSNLNNEIDAPATTTTDYR